MHKALFSGSASRLLLRIAAALLVSASAMALPALNLRDSVCLVKPVLNDGVKKTFTDIAGYFDGIGEGDIGSYFKSLAEGGSGSGFLIKDKAGKLWVVTNRHVAAYAPFATLVFEDADGKETSLPDCPVAWTDNAVDLALIEVKGTPPGPALKLAGASIEDGAEVWSAGYPGLLSRTSWQLAKGNVTNKKVSVPELGKPANAVFIQHSASIDPGNSGGPLLVGNPAKPESMQVVGINTWSARGRSNTFFAVPVGKLQETLERASAQAQGNTDHDAIRQLLVKQAQSLVSNLNAENFEEYAYLEEISWQYATEKGWPLFREGLRTLGSKERQTWLERFFSSPLDCLRQFISWKLWKKVHDAKAAIETSVDSFKIGDAGGWTSQALLNGQSALMSWTFEAGTWKLSGSDLLEKSAAPGRAAAGASSAKSSQGAGAASSEGASELEFAALNPGGIALGVGISLSPPAAFSQVPGLHLITRIDIPTGLNILGIAVEFSTNDISSLRSEVPAASAWLDQRNFRYGEVSVGFGPRLVFPISDANGYLMPFLDAQIRGCIIFATQYLDETGAIRSYTLIPGGMDMGLSAIYHLGVEYSWDKVVALGLQAGLEQSLFFLNIGSKTGPGLRAVPIDLFIKFAIVR